MKKIISVLSLCFFAAIIFSGCLKDNTIKQGLDSLGSVVNVQYSGLNYFAQAAVVTAGATAPIENTFTVNIANADGKLTDKDIVVKFAIDDAKRLAYNADPTQLDYELLPDSTYSFPTRTATIKAGTNQVTLPITFYPNKINPSKLYMLPITLIDASGLVISGNFSTLYYHIIGNPLAGLYNLTGTRTNYTGSVSWSGPPAPLPAGGTDGTTAAYTTPTVAVPVDATTVKIIMGNVPQPSGAASAYYYISGTDPAFSNITYTQGDEFNAGYTAIGRYILNYVAPTASQKARFRLITKYTNASGNDRIIDQTFIQQ
jgi:hypothetical protein